MHPMTADVPRHIAIIMDGNGRWAEARGQARHEGHEAGAKSVRVVTERARQRGVEVLTLYAFSTENWKRPAVEIQRLWSLLVRFLKSERKTLLDNGIALRMIGDIEALPKLARSTLEMVVAATQSGDAMTLNLALNYGAKAELLGAMRALQARGAAIDEEQLERHLYTAGQPPVDLFIRTGGERRLSNFLLWQAAYAELLFTDTLWPQFDADTLDACLLEFAGRERRFGRTGAQLHTGAL
jgi:undecaprenyl diphosphate synthase